MRRRRRRRLLFAASVLLVGAAALLVPMPMIAYAPGDLFDVGPFIEIEGETTPLTGELGLLTARVDPASMVGVVHAWVDDARELRPRAEVVQPGTSQRDYFREQQEVFRTAFRIAVAMGIQAAGHEVTVLTAPRVMDVVVGAPADGRLEAGDTIRRVDGIEVVTADEAVEVLRERGLGDEVAMEVERAGEVVATTIVLGDVPGLDRPGVGVSLHTVERDIALPFEVELVGQRGIGGPSAGLMMALTTYDLLAEEDLVAGRVVAGTGTIAPDGTVGRVGSVPQKTRTAVRAGADILLVPSSQVEEAEPIARGAIRVVGVDTLAEAIEALREQP